MAVRFPSRRLRRRRSLRARPQVQTLPPAERLEDRTLLAAFTVSTPNDTFDASPGDGFAADTIGATSLRAAIQEANALAGRDTIILPSGTYTLAITGIDEDSSARGDLDVTSDILIMGAGAGRTFIDAADLDRVLDVRPGANLVLTGVTLQNGLAVNAAGIRNAGSLELTDSIVTGNDASGAVNSLGGGIGNASGTLTLTRVTVSNNTATVHGGGLYSSGGSVVSTDSTFSDNSATLDGGGISVFTGTLQISDSTISNNTAGADGGGLSAEGAIVTATRVTVSGNTAVDDGGGLNVIGNGELRIFESTITTNSATTGFGGGIRTYQSTLGVTDTTITGNQAARSGGGIDNDASLLELTTSLLTANTAIENGGGLNNYFGTVGISNTTFSANTANLNGGGIHNGDQSAATIVNSTLTSNSASTGVGGGINNLTSASLANTIVAGNLGSGPDLAGSFTSPGNNLIGDVGFAGGLIGGINGDLVGGGFTPLDAMLSPLQDNGGSTFSHALLVGSLAIDAGNGNGVAVTDQTGLSRVLDGNSDGTDTVDMGAVEFREGIRTFTVTTLTDSTDVLFGDGLAEDNTGETSLRAAIQEANALPGETRIILPAGLYQVSLFDAAFDEAETSTFSGIEDLDVFGRLTIEGAGQTQTFIDAGDLFRVLHVASGANLTLKNLTVQNGDDIFGGGIYVNGGQLTLEDATVTSSTATGSVALSYGGGIAAESSSVTLTRATLAGNSADVDGAGLYVTNSALTLNASSVLNNTAARSGGGIALVNSNVQIDGSTISSNSSTDDGGGIAIGSGSVVSVATTTISSNSSGDFGGGLYVVAGSLFLIDSTIAENQAASSGGGINNEQGAITIRRTTINNNTATVSGGGIDNFQGTIGVSQTTISGNAAGSLGGGIVNFAGGAIDFQSSTIVNNTAGDLGGGLWTAGIARSGNTIVAQNSGVNGSPDMNGSVTSLGTNLIGNGVGSTGIINGVGGNLVGTSVSPIDLGLTPLQDNGGSTLTHLPLYGSAAIDGGLTALPTVVDQRGRVRIGLSKLGGPAVSDIGAVEFEGISLSAGFIDPIRLTASRENDELLIADSGSGQVLLRLPIDGLDQFQVNGGGFDDSLIIDLTGGNPLPFGGFDFVGNPDDGSTDVDSISLSSGAAQSVSHSITTGVDGIVRVDGRVASYTRVESLTDSTSASVREFRFGDASDSVVIANSGTADDGMMSISRTGGTPIEFLVPTATLAVSDSGGASVVRFDSVDDLFSSGITISTGSAGDLIDASIVDVPVTVDSGSGNDTILTGSGDDSVTSSDGDNRVFTLGGDDSVVVGAGADRVYASDGNDFIDPGAGNDRIFGGDGNDTIAGSNGRDFLRGGRDADMLKGGSGFDTLFGDHGDDTINGDNGNDTIYGGNGRDFIQGDSGNDRLFGNNGYDTISGGVGNDFVRGGRGNDRLSGDFGNDEVLGDEHRDTLFGGNGDDTLTAGDGDDRVFAAAGNDRVDGGAGNDLLFGNDGDDTLLGGTGNDSIRGGFGDDAIAGQDGDDTLIGDHDDDTLLGGAGDDAVLGGAGNDTAFGGAGVDTVIGNGGTDVLGGGAGDQLAADPGDVVNGLAGEIDEAFVVSDEWMLPV
jgi:predicted outer membrane repeat protein